MDSKDLQLVDHEYKNEVIWPVNNLQLNRWTKAVVYLEPKRKYKVSVLI